MFIAIRHIMYVTLPNRFSVFFNVTMMGSPFRVGMA